MLTQDGQGRRTRYYLPPLSDSVHKESSSVHIAEIDDYEWDTLTKIAEPARQNRRLSYEKMELVLLRLCHNRNLTKRQLAELLRRNADGLRIRF